MKSNFEQILKRIATIERDISELNRLKKRLPDDRPYYPGLQSVFDKQIQVLLAEKKSILGLRIQNPPSWLASHLNGKALEEPEETHVSEDVVSFSPLVPTGEGDVYQFLKKLPKTEVHLHLEACINQGTLRQLLEKNEVVYTEAEFQEKFNFKDLNGFIQLFFFIQSAIKEEEDFAFLVDSLADYLREDNIVYAEVFLAPTRFIQNGLDFDLIMETIVRRIREIREEDGTDIRILVDISRTFGLDNALANLEKVLRLNYEEVIGIGLGGAELLGPSKEYEQAFRVAREAGLHCVAHAGEDDGPWSIWDTLRLLKAERIGHGTSAIQDPELVEYFKENRIPIEICLTSNLFTGKYVRKPENHPVRYYYDKGLMVCINTDDPEIFNVRMTDEYYKLYKHLGFTVEEIIDLIKKGVYCSFHPRKEKLWKKMESEINRLQSKFQLVLE